MKINLVVQVLALALGLSLTFMPAALAIDEAIDTIDTIDTVSDSEELRNPFLKVEEEAALKMAGVIQEDDEGLSLNLTAIFISDKGKKALIGGQVLSEGQTVGSRQVIAITRDQVVLMDRGGQVILHLPDLFEGDTE